MPGGAGADLWSLGTAQMAACTVGANLHMALETQYWTWVNHLAIWGSILLYVVVTLALDAMPTLPQYDVLQHALATPIFWFAVVLRCAPGRAASDPSGPTRPPDGLTHARNSVSIAMAPRIVARPLYMAICPTPVEAWRAAERSC